MKLGFVLKITNEGVPGETFSINKKDSWARYTEDVRTPIKELVNFDGTEKVVYLVKFLGDIGYLICVIKARPEGSGRPNDNTAAWIFFPAIVNISSEETVKVLKTVEEAISGKKGTNFEQLNILFDHEYETNNVLISAVGTICSRSDSTYTIRYYNGDFTLYELLGNYIAQQEYSNYKGIILIDKTMGIKHSSNSELNFEPRQICTYNPISHIDGFTPFIFANNQCIPFEKSLEVPIGTPITIYWKKNGYGIIKKTFVAEHNSIYPETAKINQKDYKIIIPKKLFYVIDPDGIPVNQFNVSINHHMMEGNTMEVSEANYQQGLTISIDAKGFNEWKETVANLPLDKQKTVKLSKQTFHYEFAIPVYDEEKKNNEAIVIVETFHKLNSSPIKGYTLEGIRIQDGEGRVNRLIIDDKIFSKLRYIAYGFVLCIFIQLMFAGYSALENYEFKIGWPPIKEKKQVSKTDMNTSNVDLEEVNQLNTDSVNALIYLETNDIWHKDTLEKYESTRGLFDDLNTFNVNGLMVRKEGVLNNSGRMTAIIERLSEYLKEGKDPHKGKEKNGGNYNSLNDKGIDVNNYLKWLSEEHATVDIFSSNKTAPQEHISPISGKTERDTKRATNTQTQNEQTKKGGPRGSIN